MDAADLYLRLSLDFEGATSIDRQESDCRRWCAAHSLPVRRVLAVEKVELWRGQVLFYGAFDERNVETARRCFPGRPASLTEDGGLMVGTAT